MANNNRKIVNFPNELKMPHLYKDSERTRGLESVPSHDLDIIDAALSLPEKERIAFVEVERSTYAFPVGQVVS
jgi:hypothetical protein